MRCGIFYLSYRPGPDKVPFTLSDGRCVFIRCIEVECADVSEALDMAEPIKGESLMNTHALNKKDAR